MANHNLIYVACQTVGIPPHSNTKHLAGGSLEETHTRQRLHSALRYLTPDEFEKSLKTVESDRADGNFGKPKPGPEAGWYGER
jgi:hypothetical protein